MEQSLISDFHIPQHQEKTTSNLATVQWACPNSCHSLWQTIPPRTQSVSHGLRRRRSRSLRASVTCSQTAPKMWQWPSLPRSPKLIQHSKYLVKSLRSSWEKHKTRFDFFYINIRNIMKTWLIVALIYSSNLSYIHLYSLGTLTWHIGKSRVLIDFLAFLRNELRPIGGLSRLWFLFCV